MHTGCLGKLTLTIIYALQTDPTRFHIHSLARNTGAAHLGEGYTLDVLTSHYELALLDFVRFRVGWGTRRAPEWSERRARELIESGFI